MRRRVILSGLGLLSCAGANVEASRGNFLAGRCCLSAIDDRRVAHLKARFAGLVRGAETEARIQAAGFEAFDRYVQLAVVAAREAVASAGIDPPALGRRMGLVFSTCSGPMLLIEAHYERIIRGEAAIGEDALFAKRYYAGARVLAHALGLQGICTTVVTACSASTAAIALAADLIRCGLLDAALAGGADAFSTSTLAGFDGLKATSEGQCAPFSKPYGLNLGEAAAFMVLETPESARHRGAPVRAELLGSGMSNDAYHCSSPEPGGRGLALAMRRALADAGLSPAQITYINAHGTGTEANDKAETRAVRKVFGEHAGQVPISSTKSMVGHCLGAAGAVETIASLLCAEAGVVPPTANFTEPREGCSLDYVPEVGRPWSGSRVFLSNNSAFGGHNASLAVALPGETAPPLPAAPPPETICVTGWGLVSSLGLGLAALQEAMRSGRSGIGTVTYAGRPPLPAALVDADAMGKADRRLDLRDMDRSSRWATVAAQLAIREARFPERPAALADLGLFLSLSAGPSWAESEYLTTFLQNDRQVKQLAAFPYIVPGSVAGNVCRALMLAGPNVTLSGGPGAGLLGLAHAVCALHSGHAEALLSGAVDELSERILTDHSSAGLLGRDGAAPPGEGAAVLLLETETHARKRGATPLAEVCSLAFSTETQHARQPNARPDVLEDTIQDALDQAGIKADDVGAFCMTSPAARVRATAARFGADWRERRVEAAPRTGELEGAQPLLDLALALAGLPADAGRRHVLAVVSSPQGLNAAWVFKKVANAPSAPPR